MGQVLDSNSDQRNGKASKKGACDTPACRASEVDCQQRHHEVNAVGGNQDKLLLPCNEIRQVQWTADQTAMIHSTGNACYATYVPMAGFFMRGRMAGMKAISASIIVLSGAIMVSVGATQHDYTKFVVCTFGGILGWVGITDW